METALESLSKDDLLKAISSRDEKIEYLESQLAMYKRMQFGQKRSAMIYSFFAICKKHEVNPYQWLKHTLLNIASIKHKNIKDLYPQNYKQIIDKSNM